jgi:hypothetical protein
MQVFDVNVMLPSGAETPSRFPPGRGRFSKLPDRRQQKIGCILPNAGRDVTILSHKCGRDSTF